MKRFQLPPFPAWTGNFPFRNLLILTAGLTAMALTVAIVDCACGVRGAWENPFAQSLPMVLLLAAPLGLTGRVSRLYGAAVLTLGAFAAAGALLVAFEVPNPERSDLLYIWRLGCGVWKSHALWIVLPLLAGATAAAAAMRPFRSRSKWAWLTLLLIVPWGIATLRETRGVRGNPEKYAYRHPLSGIAFTLWTAWNPARPSASNRTLAEGTVLRRSPLPNAAKSDYPDCDYTAEIEVVQPLTGPPLPPRLVAVLPGFRGRKNVPSSRFRVGDKVRLELEPFAEVPASRQAIQQSDTLEAFDLEVFLARVAQPLAEFTPQREFVTRKPGPPYESGFVAPLNPADSRAEALRAETLAADRAALDRAAAVLAARGPALAAEFLQDWRKLRAQLPTLEDKDIEVGYRQSGKGFFTLARDFELYGRTGVKAWETMPESMMWELSPYNPNWEKFALEPLIALHEYLRFHHIDLVVVLVPDLWQVAARVLLPAYRNAPDALGLNPARVLQKHGIEALYLTDQVAAAAPDYELTYWYDRLFDGHPERGFLETAARELARRLARYRLPEVLDRKKFAIRPTPRFPRRWPAAWGTHREGEPIPCPVVEYNGKPLKPTAPKSPLLVIGNSYAQSPDGRGFPGFLSRQLGMEVDFLAVEGDGLSGAIPVRLLLERERFLRGKKAVIMPIGYAHLFFRNWRNVKEVDGLLRHRPGAVAATAARWTTVAPPLPPPTVKQRLAAKKFVADNHPPLFLPRRGDRVGLRFEFPEAGELELSVWSPSQLRVGTLGVFREQKLLLFKVAQPGSFTLPVEALDNDGVLFIKSAQFRKK